MARIVKESITDTLEASVSSFSPTLPPSSNYAIGDLLVVLVQNRSSATLSISGSGWAIAGTQTPASGSNQLFAWKVVGAVPETGPTFTGVTTFFGATSFVIKDADATTPIDSSNCAVSTYSSVASVASPSLTTTTDNRLLIYGFGSRFGGDTAFLRTKLDDLYVRSTVINAQSSYMFGTRQQGTAGAVPSVTAYFNSASSNGNAWVIGIKNKTSGELCPDVRSGSSEPMYYGDFGVQQATLTWGPLSSTGGGTNGFISGTNKTLTVNSINGSTTAATVSDAAAYAAVASGSAGSPFGRATSLSSSENTAGAWVGAWHAPVGGTIDLTGKIFSINFGVDPNSTARFGDEGVIVVFSDANDYWTAYQLSPRIGLLSASTYLSQIACGNATAYATGGGGSTDFSAVTRIAYAYHRVGSTASATLLFLYNEFLMNTAVITGGGETEPSSWKDVPLAMGVFNSVMLSDLQASAQTQGKNKIQIGDGSTPTYFSASATSFEYPKSYAVVNQKSQRYWNAGDLSVGVTIKASSSDTIDLSASVSATETRQPFTIHSASSTSATYFTTGASLIGFDVTWKTGVPCSGVTFKNGGKIDFKGADVVSASIFKPLDSDAAAAFTESGGSMDGCTIDITGTGADYHIEVGDGGTGDFAITLTDQVFTGTPGVDKVHVTNTSGTTTITISGTTSLVAGDVTSAGATVVITAPQPTLDATVLASSRVVLYNDTTDAELDNAAPGGTAWSKTITSGASIGDQLTLHVFKEGYEEFSTSFLYAGTDTTLLVSQAVHPHIASLRTELGISDYTTITEFTLDITGTVEIDADDADGNTQKARLAIWYNGILTTENGARYLRGAISVLSTAAIRINVATLDLQLTNVSVTYGLNFTDTERRLYRSDGTPIYSATSAAGSIQNDYSGVPDTVETGVSGLTGSESAQLMALPTAATVATAVWSKELPL